MLGWQDDFASKDASTAKSLTLTPRQIAVLVSGIPIIRDSENWSDWDLERDAIDSELSSILHKLTVADS
jgi:hypothetical protein